MKAVWLKKKSSHAGLDRSKAKTAGVNVGMEQFNVRVAGWLYRHFLKYGKVLKLNALCNREPVI